MNFEEERLLYNNNVGRKSFQWELWRECNNLCKFCYLGTENRTTPKEVKLDSIRKCYEAVSNLDFNAYNSVSILGGEFFQGQISDPEVKDAFFHLIDLFTSLYVEKKIGQIWIMATMISKDQHDLWETVQRMYSNGVIPVEGQGSSGLWICTSYDSDGRFHTPQAEEDWKANVKKLHEDFPWVRINTTIIFQESMCQRYLSGEWSPRKFKEEFHTSLFLKIPSEDVFVQGHLQKSAIFGGAMSPTEFRRYGKGLAREITGLEFNPKRDSFLKVLVKMLKEDPEEYDKMFNIKYRADEMVASHNDSQNNEYVRNKGRSFTDITDREVPGTDYDGSNVCGHSYAYTIYSDSDACALCDRNHIYELYKEG